MINKLRIANLDNYYTYIHSDDQLRWFQKLQQYNEKIFETMCISPTLYTEFKNQLDNSMALKGDEFF